MGMPFFVGALLEYLVNLAEKDVKIDTHDGCHEAADDRAAQRFDRHDADNEELGVCEWQARQLIGHHHVRAVLG